MVRIMDTTTISSTQTETERYGDEVLNANWLPQDALMCAAEAAHASEHPHTCTVDNPDEFLRTLYSAQE